MRIRTQEAFNFYSHLTGALLSLTGLIFLLRVTYSSLPALITALIYGVSIVFLFSASSLYHAFKKEENELSIWRRIDRLAIFFMIAGTYTPMCYFCLDGVWRWAIIGLQWGLVGFGLVSQLYFPRAPRSLYAAIYLSMGWLAVFPLGQLLDRLTPVQQILLFGGGIAFTAGGVIYAVKWPKIAPGIFSFHEIFHVTVLLGGSLHYALICNVFVKAVV